MLRKNSRKYNLYNLLFDLEFEYLDWEPMYINFITTRRYFCIILKKTSKIMRSVAPGLCLDFLRKVLFKMLKQKRFMDQSGWTGWHVLCSPPMSYGNIFLEHRCYYVSLYVYFFNQLNSIIVFFKFPKLIQLGWFPN